MSTQVFESDMSLALFSSTTGTPTLEGKITGIVIKEIDEKGNPQPTNNIVRTDRDWTIMLTWKLMGSLLDVAVVSGPGPITAEIHGNFIVNAYLEGLGKATIEDEFPGDSKAISVMNDVKAHVKQGSLTATPTIPVNPPDTEWQYNETITIKSKRLPAGPYKLAVTLTYEKPNSDGTGFVPGPMAGFMEYPDLIQIYDPGK